MIPRPANHRPQACLRESMNKTKVLAWLRRTTGEAPSNLTDRVADVHSRTARTRLCYRRLDFKTMVSTIVKSQWDDQI